MNPRSTFSYEIINDVLVIHDLNEGMSVTNDMENVLEYINKNNPLPNKIVYRDSEGVFDGVLYKNGEVTFYPIQTVFEVLAVAEARDI